VRLRRVKWVHSQHLADLRSILAIFQFGCSIPRNTSHRDDTCPSPAPFRVRIPETPSSRPAFRAASLSPQYGIRLGSSSFLWAFRSLEVFFQHAAKQNAPSTLPKGSAISGYISVLVLEWLLVLYVRMGVHKCGVRLRDLVGGRWATPKAVVKDIALGAVLWLAWIGLTNSHVLGGGTNAAQRTSSPGDS
jgi:hypothetical protein